MSKLKNMQHNDKHVPMRTCIVTRKKLPKNELLRLVRTESGEIKVDVKGKLKGRGANIIPEIEVFDKAIAEGILKKALKLEKSLSKDELEKLRSEFLTAIDEKNFRPHNKPVSIRVDRHTLEQI